LEWSEVDIENKRITIPADKMKMKREFISPISNTIVQILDETRRYSGDGKYVFPSSIHKDRPLSENTLNVGLRRLGYTREQIVSHSFRGIFSTIAHDHMQEHGCSSLAIEAQLAHKDTNQMRDTYNSSSLLKERTKLVEWWSDYLNTQKTNSLKMKTP
jgi:integrase